MKKPKVSVIITARNYGRYLEKCLNSVLNQTFKDYEIVVVDDGSTDDTPKILEIFEKKYPEKIKIIHLDGLGLPTACNRGIKASSGTYIIRLDADDFFDENTLLIEANFLDSHPEIDLVYPDYYEITQDGEIIDHKRLLKVGDEVKFLDRSPLAAGAMFRRRCYEELGGYNEKLKYQEDYDFWLRFTNKFKVFNINLPLYYYRRHPASMSTNFLARMQARRQVKEEFVKKHLKEKIKTLKILAVIPVRGEDNTAMRMLNGKPLIAYTIEEAKKVKYFNKILVSTDGKEIINFSKKIGAEAPFVRPAELSKPGVPIEKVLKHALDFLKERENFIPDIITILYVISPFKKAEHIEEAINTMLIFNFDSVISVCEDQRFYWKPGAYGLTPLFEKRLVKMDKETLYRENGAIYVTKRETLEKEGSVIGESVGHILMSEEESIRINSEFDFWLAEQILKRGKK